MTLAPVQLIGTAITPVSGQSTPSSTSSSSYSGTVGSGASYLNLLGSAASAAGTTSSNGSAPGVPNSATSGSSGITPGQAIGAAKVGGSLTGNGTLSTAAGLAGNALAIYNGLNQGGVVGYGSAALAGVKAANTIDQVATGSGFLSSGAAAGIGAAGDVLGIYSGLKQGGIAGYGGAALDAYNLYSTAAPIVESLISGGSAAAGAGASAAGAGASAAGGAAAGGAATAGSIASGIAAPLGVVAMGIMSTNAPEILNAWDRPTAGVTETPRLASVGSLGQILSPGEDIHGETGTMNPGQYTENGKGLGSIADTNDLEQFGAYANTSTAAGGLGGNLSSIKYDPTASNVGTNGIKAPLQQNSFGVQTNQGQYLSPSQISEQMSAVYNNGGGQQGWGTSFEDFLSAANLLWSAQGG